MSRVFRVVRTVEEIFGESLPPLTGEQQVQLEQVLVAAIETIFRGPYQQMHGHRNRAMAKLLLLEGVTLREVATGFGITHSRVGQLRLKALRLLRHPTRSRPMRVFFQKDEEEWMPKKLDQPRTFEVAVNELGEVVLNIQHLEMNEEGWGHLSFTPLQAAEFIRVLIEATKFATTRYRPV